MAGWSSTRIAAEATCAWLQLRSSWQRLHAQDEETLEAATTGRAADAAPQAGVGVCGGRWEATLTLWHDSSGAGNHGLGVVGTLRPRFEIRSDVVLVRSRWCYRRSGAWMPFAGAQDADLEESFDKVRAEGEAAAAAAAAAATTTATAKGAATVSTAGSAPSPPSAPTPRRVVEVTLAGGELFRVTLEWERRSGAVLAQMWPEGAGWMTRQCAVSRGWAGDALPALTADELAVATAPCRSLVLVVHGAGHAFWRNREGRVLLSETTDKLRRHAAKAAVAEAAATGDPLERVECAPSFLLQQPS